jgi:hypothetical protein
MKKAARQLLSNRCASPGSLARLRDSVPAHVHDRAFASGSFQELGRRSAQMNKLMSGTAIVSVGSWIGIELYVVVAHTVFLLKPLLIGAYS